MLVSGAAESISGELFVSPSLLLSLLPLLESEKLSVAVELPSFVSSLVFESEPDAGVWGVKAAGGFNNPVKTPEADISPKSKSEPMPKLNWP